MENVSIYAFDIDELILQKAGRGIYPAAALRKASIGMAKAFLQRRRRCTASGDRDTARADAVPVPQPAGRCSVLHARPDQLPQQPRHVPAASTRTFHRAIPFRTQADRLLVPRLRRRQQGTRQPIRAGVRALAPLLAVSSRWRWHACSELAAGESRANASQRGQSNRPFRGIRRACSARTGRSIRPAIGADHPQGRVSLVLTGQPVTTRTNHPAYGPGSCRRWSTTACGSPCARPASARRARTWP